MGVKLAKTAGFCWGVKRAMDQALRTAVEADPPVRTLGPLIHNRQAIDLLKSKRIGQIDDVAAIESSMMVIIRAHGVTPLTRERILERGARICDATCPHVIRAQRLVERHTREGRDAIVVGDRDHAETIGIVGHCAAARGEAGGGRAFVVESIADIAALPDDLGEIVVVAQTTQEQGRFERVAEELVRRRPDAHIHNTVCSDASNRQAELKELASQVDAIVVVGGRHSANTNRLAQISRESGTPTWLVETADELDLVALRTYRNIGVTAGASTPQWIINLVVERLRALEESKRPLPARIVSAVMRFLVIGQFYLALGAGLLTWAACDLMGATPGLRWSGLAAFFVLALHLFHRYLHLPVTPSVLHGPHQYFYRRRKVYLVLCALSAGGALVCATFIHPLFLALLAAGFLVGASYIWATRPAEEDTSTMARWFKRIQGSKDLFMAAAWSAVVAGAPFIHHWLPGSPAFGLAPSPRPDVLGFVLATGVVFLLVMIRSVLIDLRDIDDDLVVGRDTLPIVLGMQAMARLTQVGVALFALCFVAALARAHGWGAIGWATLPVALVVLNVALTLRQNIQQGAFWDALIDGQILLAALCAILAGGGAGRA